jgi:metallo-beta-lactamase class B
MRIACLALLAAVSCLAQRSLQQSDWTKPTTPHRIVGSVYYVGTYDLACFLITSPEGHILINTGLADSTTQIRKNIETLGFRFSDIRILLTNQGHFDHVAAMAEIKDSTAARLLATEADKEVLENGGASDFYLGKEYAFKPVKVDGIVSDGMEISIGRERPVRLRAHLTPGHTKGSVSYSMAVRENGRIYNVVIANIPTTIGAKLVNNTKYPGIATDYERSFRVLRALACDIFLAAHASQYRLHEKYKGKYDPDVFIDPEGLKRAVTESEAKFRAQLKQEQSEVR